MVGKIDADKDLSCELSQLDRIEYNQEMREIKERNNPARLMLLGFLYVLIVLMGSGIILQGLKIDGKDLNVSFNNFTNTFLGISTIVVIFFALVYTIYSKEAYEKEMLKLNAKYFKVEVRRKK